MAKSRKNYGLPKLTLAEAAAILDVREGELRLFIMEVMKPSPSEWSRWERGGRDLPEETIRLYLTRSRGAVQLPSPTPPPPPARDDLGAARQRRRRAAR